MKDKTLPDLREHENFTQACVCDHCGCSLDKYKTIWVWNEHFGCSRDHAQRAQGNANAIASVGVFKQSLEKHDRDLL